MNEINFIHLAGPFGDCTNSYLVQFPKGITVDEFINKVLMERGRKEWGLFYAGREVLFEYKGGNAWQKCQDYQKYKDRIVIDARANGGWSRLDYSLSLKPIEKPKLKVDLNEKTQFPF